MTGGVPTIINHLQGFQNAVSNAFDPDELDELSQTHQLGEISRVLIDVLARASTPDSEIAPRNILDIGEEKLRHFPFFYAGVERALDQAD